MYTAEAIVVGHEQDAFFERLDRALHSVDVDTFHVDSPADLGPALHSHPHAGVLVYSASHGGRSAEAVFETLERLHQHSPVFVVTDHPEYEHHCEMIDHGVWGYYPLGDSPEAISKGVSASLRSAA